MRETVRLLRGIAVLFCSAVICACQPFFFEDSKEREVGRLNTKEVIVHVLGVPLALQVGDSVHLTVIALTPDGRTVTAMLGNLRWRVTPIDVGHLGGGNQLPITQRWLKGVGVGTAELTVDASVQWLEEKSSRNVEIKYGMDVHSPP